MHSYAKGSCVPINVGIRAFVGNLYVPIATEKARGSLLHPSVIYRVRSSRV